MFFLVPHGVTTTTATLWAGAMDEALPPSQWQILPDLPGRATFHNPREWPEGARQPRIRYRHVEVAGLEPRQTYAFSLVAGGRRVADARATTLPTQMPLLGEKPFVALLGSCFSHREDREGKVENTFLRLPHPAQPDVKLLAGDQVYLDSPWYRFTGDRYSASELREIFVEHYRNTWGGHSGVGLMLMEGANYFSSDDHEFWNNAPNMAPHILNSWPLLGSREEWWDAAGELYRVFQGGNPIQRFDVPPASFLIADTRMNRADKQTEFMNPADLARVDTWVSGLSGPGVLVIGQPLLQTSTGFFAGHLKDWNLPDYEQYHRLVEIIGRSRHSLVILTGDVHYGRIARSSLRSGAELVEIIASPMSLVDAKAKGTWEPAPAVFPGPGPESGTPASLARSGVVTERDFSPNDAHFLTLEFSRRGAGVHLRLRYWPILDRGVAPRDFGKSIWERMLA